MALVSPARASLPLTYLGGVSPRRAGDGPPQCSWREAKQSAWVNYWTALYIACEGNAQQMSLIADVRRNEVYRHMRRVGLEPKFEWYGRRGNWER